MPFFESCTPLTFNRGLKSTYLGRYLSTYYYSIILLACKRKKRLLQRQKTNVDWARAC